VAVVAVLRLLPRLAVVALVLVLVLVLRLATP
jgi:hypothetical protein